MVINTLPDGREHCVQCFNPKAGLSSKYRHSDIYCLTYLEDLLDEFELPALRQRAEIGI